jgi:hypothetical protein
MNPIVEKVWKLLALAESAKKIGSLAEAENAMAKAQHLMTEHRLSMGAVSEETTNRTYGHSGLISTVSPYGDGEWRFDLLTVIASQNLCVVTGLTGSKKRVVWGRSENIEVVLYLFDFISPRLLKLAHAYVAGLPGRKRSAKSQAKIKGEYLLGAVRGIHKKLKEQQSGHEKAAAIGALMVRERDSINDFLAQKFGPLDQRKRKKSNANEHSAAGYSDGRKMEINKGVGQGAKVADALLVLGF